MLWFELGEADHRKLACSFCFEVGTDRRSKVQFGSKNKFTKLTVLKFDILLRMVLEQYKSDPLHDLNWERFELMNGISWNTEELNIFKPETESVIRSGGISIHTKKPFCMKDWVAVTLGQNLLQSKLLFLFILCRLQLQFTIYLSKIKI